MGRKPLVALVAALLGACTLAVRAQDREWDESIDSARQAAASKQFEQAERILRQARTQSRGFQPNDPRRVVPLLELAKLHLDRGDYARPEQLYREADPIAREAWGADSAEYASLLNDIGRYYHLRVRFDDAERFYKLAFATRVRLLGREHADVATSVNNLAVLYENEVLYPKAETYYRTALDIREKQLGPQHEDTVLTLEHLARLLHKMSRPNEAAEFERRAQEYRTSKADPQTDAGLASAASGRVDQSAVLLEQTEPDYTDEARIANHEGNVLLQAVVDTDGRARNISVLRHLGLGLDEQAVAAVRQWRFRPARRNGQRVPSTVRLEIAFRLM